MKWNKRVVWIEVENGEAKVVKFDGPTDVTVMIINKDKGEG